ncbi:MAG: rhodanese-like domain-containing protein [Planctomycetota bacterium]
MRKVAVLAVLLLAWVSSAVQADDPASMEKELLNKTIQRIPPDRVIGTEQFKRIYDEVMAGNRKAYLIDVRTHPEFYAGHIEGTDHVPAGNLRNLMEIIKDPDVQIILWCRTNPRTYYSAAFLYDCGYKNVWVWKDGIVGWIEKGYPLVNQFMGRFTVTDYDKDLNEMDKEGKPLWRVRLFHPY